MKEPGERARLEGFERLLLPHLDAAYNLARWLTRNAVDAEDVVQEAYMRALSHFAGYRGPDARAWLLAIVRNTCYSWQHKNRPAALLPFDEEQHGSLAAAADPERAQQLKDERERLRNAIDGLPAEFREVLILREMEELSYRQIAGVTEVPLGTVMSRLARARRKLAGVLGKQEEVRA